MTDTEKSYDIRGILLEMRDEYRRAIEEGEETQTETTRDYVVFRLAGETFGIASRFTREVLRVPRLVRIPRLPEEIAGIFNLRGQIVAVTDLRPLLGLAGRELPSNVQVIVVEVAGLLTALFTEKVEGMRAIPEAEIEPIAHGMTGFPREIAEGTYPDERGLLTLLDLERILSRPEFTIDQKRAAL